MGPALRRLAVELHPPASREQVGQAVGVEPVPEAVADGDLCDLREAPEVALGGLSHGISVAPAAGFSSPCPLEPRPSPGTRTRLKGLVARDRDGPRLRLHEPE